VSRSLCIRSSAHPETLAFRGRHGHQIHDKVRISACLYLRASADSGGIPGGKVNCRKATKTSVRRVIALIIVSRYMLYLQKLSPLWMTSSHRLSSSTMLVKSSKSKWYTLENTRMWLGLIAHAQARKPCASDRTPTHHPIARAHAYIARWHAPPPYPQSMSTRACLHVFAYA
jgi:hypothetical protein